MSQQKASFRKALVFCKDALCVFLILLLLFWMAAPFFQLYKPSMEQMTFIHLLRPKGAELFATRRKAYFPFPGCNQIEARIVLPADLNFDQWFSDTLGKMAVSDIKRDGDSVSATVQTDDGKQISLQAKLQKNILSFHLKF